MINKNPDERPDCKKLLDCEYLWRLSRRELDMNESDIDEELLDISYRVPKSSNKSDTEGNECYLRSIVNSKLLNKTDELLKWLLSITKYFINKIKYLFIYRLREIFKIIIVVTKDDKVYECESYSLSSMNEKWIINPLCEKGLVGFVNGWNHVIGRTDKGKIDCFGGNGKGQLGNGKKYYFYDYPKLNEYLKNKFIVAVCCGYFHSLALTREGQVFAWGCNKTGEIGNGSEERYQLIPIEVKDFNMEKVKQIACGGFHSMVLTEDGHVFAWGFNHFGQLGFGHTIDSNEPQLIQLENIFIDKISCGKSHSILLSTNGDIYVFGSNDWHQLGIKSDEFQLVPKKLNDCIKFNDIAAHSLYNISMAKSVDGKIYVWGVCGHEIIKEPKENNFNSFVDIFAEYLKIINGFEPHDDIFVIKDTAIHGGFYYN